MKLKIVSVHNQGDFDKEHVLLRAVEDCNLTHYLLADTTYIKDDVVSNRLRHTYWFIDKPIKKGDYVSVWTKSGIDTEGTMQDGTPIHRLFWNLKTAVWNDTGDCAILVYTPNWQQFKV